MCSNLCHLPSFKIPGYGKAWVLQKDTQLWWKATYKFTLLTSWGTSLFKGNVFKDWHHFFLKALSPLWPEKLKQRLNFVTHPVCCVTVVWLSSRNSLSEEKKGELLILHFSSSLILYAWKCLFRMLCTMQLTNSRLDEAFSPAHEAPSASASSLEDNKKHWLLQMQQETKNFFFHFCKLMWTKTIGTGKTSDLWSQHAQACLRPFSRAK